MLERLVCVVGLPIVTEALWTDQQPELGRQCLKRKLQDRCSTKGSGTLSILRESPLEIRLRHLYFSKRQRLPLVQEHRPVDRIALNRLESCVANHLAQLLLGRRIGPLGVQHTAYIVAAEAKPDL